MNTKRLAWNLFDLIIVGYCLTTTLIILLFGQPLSEYMDEIIFYLSMAGLASIIVYFFDENKSSFNRFIRLFYPVFMLTFFYRETGGLMFLFFGSFYDLQLTMFEKSILGVNPSLFIDKHMLNIFINELLSFCYFIYYLLIPWFMVYTYLKKDFSVIKSFLSAACLTFFTSYWLFSLYPIEGPRWFFQDIYINNIDGIIFRPLVEFVIGTAAVRGGCMPSSHFGVALVILLYSYRHYRNVTVYLFPIVIGLGLGTVWGRFHYVSDVIVGGIIGLIAVWVIRKLENRSIKIEYNNKHEEITV